MATKTIIPIDIDDSKFQRFKELFDRYNAQLEKMPGVWKKANQEQSETASHFQKMAAAMMSINQLRSEAANAASGEEKHLSFASRAWSTIALASKSTAIAALSITRNLIRWTGIVSAVGGLLGAGGLFGLERLAGGVADRRRTASGLGLSTGELSSFRINFGRLVDPDAYLGYVNSMETDISKQGAAFALLGHGLSGNTNKDALEFLKAIRSKAQSLPTNQLGTVLREGYGVNMSDEELRRLQKMSNSEFNSLVANHGVDSKTFAVSEATNRGWQDFLTQLHRAGESIFTVFVRALGPLTPSLEHLSKSIVHIIEKMSESGTFARAIDTVAGWLTRLAEAMENGQLADKFKSFMDDLSQLGSVIHALAHPIDSTFGPKSGAERWGEFKNFFAPNRAFSAAHMHTFEQQLEFKNGLSPGLLGTVERLEGAPDNFTNPRGGAMGRFQFKPGTWADWGEGGNPYDPVDAAQAAARFLAHLSNHFGGDVRKTLAAYNQGEAGVDAAIAAAKKNGGDWASYLKPEGQQYISRGMKITIENNTGGSAVVAASGFAQ